MAEVTLATQVAPTSVNSGFGSGYFDSTKKLWSSKDDAGSVINYPMQVANASIAAAAAAFAADTYLSGSSCQIPVVGDWKAAQQYRCRFDMVKTAAGTAAFTVNVRMGTGGVVGDASVLSLAFAVGTAAIDSGMFELILNFRAVGAGTTAIVAGVITCDHALAATGLITTGASGWGMISGTSAGFNSTTQNFIGLSVNGGASFSGTNTIVQSKLTR